MQVLRRQYWPGSSKI